MSKRSFILSLVAAASIGAAVQVVHAQLPTATVSDAVSVEELKSVTIPVSCSRGTPMVRVADETYARAETISGTNNVTIHGLKLTNRGEVGASVLCGGLPTTTFRIFVTPQDRDIGAPFLFYRERNYAGTPFKVLSTSCADLGDANARCVEPALGPEDKIVSVKLGSRAAHRGTGWEYASHVLMYQYPNFQGLCTELTQDTASVAAPTVKGGVGVAGGSYRISSDNCHPQVAVEPSKPVEPVGTLGMPTASVSRFVKVEELKSVTIPVSCSSGTPMVRIADETYARAETISETNNVTIHGLKLTNQEGVGASVFCSGRVTGATFSIIVKAQDRGLGAPFFFYGERNYAGTPFKVLSTSCADLGDANAGCVEPRLGPQDKIASVKLGSNESPTNRKGAKEWQAAGAVLMYQYPNFQGVCTELTQDTASIAGPTVMGGVFGSYRISNNLDCPPQAAFYPSAVFAGIPVTVAGSVSDLSAVNFNDAASSIRLLNGASRAAVYEDVNYGGRCQTIVMDTPSLSAMVGLDQKISSVIVGGFCPTTIHITVKNQAGFDTLEAGVHGETSKILAFGTKTWDVPISMSNPTVHVALKYVDIDGVTHMVLAKDIGASVSIETSGSGRYTCTPSGACQ
jgi:hypothetical protein